MEKKLLTVQETAEALGLAPGTIYNKIHKNSDLPFELKPIRIGRSVRFRKSDVEKLVNGELLNDAA